MKTGYWNRLSEVSKSVPGTGSDNRSGAFRLGEFTPPLGGVPITGNRPAFPVTQKRGYRNLKFQTTDRPKFSGPAPAIQAGKPKHQNTMKMKNETYTAAVKITSSCLVGGMHLQEGDHYEMMALPVGEAGAGE